MFGIGIYRQGLNRTAIAMPFWDLNSLHSSTVIYPGITAEYLASKERKFRLQIALANFGSSPQSATVWLMSGTGAGSTQEAIAKTTVPAGSIAIAESREISPDPFGGNSIVIRADGRPGEVLSAILSRLGTEQTSIILPGKDEAEVENGGEHPWTVSDTISSELLLFNPDAASKNESVQLSVHAGEQRWTKTISIEPLETLRISLNDIIRKQQLDDKGRNLPKDSWRGIVTWSTGLKPRIFGKLVQTDDYTNISRAYACGAFVSVCGVVLSSANPNPITVGQQTSVELLEIQACTGDGPCSCNDGGGSATTGGTVLWSEDSRSIISLMSSTAGSATYNGEGLGSTFADASVLDSNGCSGGGGTPISVAAPYSSQIVSTIQNNALSSGQSPCAPGYAGWIRVVNKVVTYQSGAAVAIAGQALTETVTLQSPNDLLIGSVATGNATTDSSGGFQDTLYVCSSVCPASSGSTVAQQQISDSVNGTSYNLTPNTFTYQCSGMLINGQ